jgi:hypothetical protein
MKNLSEFLINVSLYRFTVSLKFDMVEVLLIWRVILYKLAQLYHV